MPSQIINCLLEKKEMYLNSKELCIEIIHTAQKMEQQPSIKKGAILIKVSARLFSLKPEPIMINQT